MNAGRSPAFAAALFVVVGGAACGAKAPSTEPRQADAAAVDLLVQVPADTPYLVHVFPEMAHLLGEGVGGEITASLKAKILDADTLSTSTPKERFRSELARELAPLDKAALARVGWDTEKSQAVLYGYGLLPVVRATMDGAKARAALERAAGRAGITLQKLEANGVPYLVLPPTASPDGPSMVFVFHPQQVAAAVTYEPAAMVPHLASLAPAKPSFAGLRSSWPRDPGAPVNAKLFGAIDPASIAKGLRAGDLARLTNDEDISPACTAAIADTVDDFPKLVTEYWREGDEVTQSYSVAKNALLAELVDGAPGLPHWIDTPAPILQLGIGVSPARAMALAETVWSRIQATKVACGKEAASPLDFGPHGAALSHVRGLSVVGDIHGKDVHLGGEIIVDDAAPVWAWMGPTFFDQALPDLEPNKITPLGNVNNLELALGFKETHIWGSLGSPDRALQLGKPGLVPPVPGTLFRLHIDRQLIKSVRAGEVVFFGLDFAGEGRQYDSSMDFDISVRDDVIVGRTWASMRLATTP